MFEPTSFMCFCKFTISRVKVFTDFVRHFDFVPHSIWNLGFIATVFFWEVTIVRSDKKHRRLSVIDYDSEPVYTFISLQQNLVSLPAYHLFNQLPDLDIFLPRLTSIMVGSSTSLYHLQADPSCSLPSSECQTPINVLTLGYRLWSLTSFKYFGHFCKPIGIA